MEQHCVMPEIHPAFQLGINFSTFEMTETPGRQPSLPPAVIRCPPAIMILAVNGQIGAIARQLNAKSAALACLPQRAGDIDSQQSSKACRQ